MEAVEQTPTEPIPNFTSPGYTAKKEKPLSFRYRTFCRIYAQNGYNGTKAYLEVYPLVTEKTARSRAAELLALPSIRTEIERLSQVRTKTYGKKWVIERAIDLAETSKSEKIRLDALNFYAKLEGMLIERQVSMTLNLNKAKQLAPNMSLDEITEHVLSKVKMLSVNNAQDALGQAEDTQAQDEAKVLTTGNVEIMDTNAEQNTGTHERA